MLRSLRGESTISGAGFAEIIAKGRGVSASASRLLAEPRPDLQALSSGASARIAPIAAL